MLYLFTCTSSHKFYTKSTFTAALIISFLAFAEQVTGSAAGVAYETGMLLSFIATGVHLATVLVAGRAGNLCFHRAKNVDLHVSLKDTSIKEFQRLRTLCDHLQLIGTLIFIPSILFMLYFLFVQKIFAYILYGMSLCAVVTVYRIGFWKVSILWEDIMNAWSRLITRKKNTLGAHSP